MVATRGLSWHQGDRSEYLVQYALSAIAAVVPVIRQEDYGVDFLCNLTTQKGNSLVVGPAFGLQAKSAAETELTYGVIKDGNKKGEPKPEEIDWLYGQDNPLFFVSVDREQLTLKLYSASRVWRPYWREGPPRETTLVFDIDKCEGESKGQPYTSARDADKDNMPTTRIPLGPPVISLDLRGPSTEDKDVRAKLSNCLAYWIELDRKNITNNKLRIPCFYESLHWAGNEIPARTDEAIFHAFNSNPSQNIENVVRSISPGLTNLAYNLIAQSQEAQLRALIPALELLTSFHTPDREMIQVAVDAARERLGSPGAYGPMQASLSEKTHGATSSLSGYQGQ